MDKVLVLDFGSQTTQLIARRIRGIGVYSEVLPGDTEFSNGLPEEVKGIIYGGRDSDTWPPVFQSFNWEHGVITIGASLESETTSATLGEEGVRRFNLMANLDCLSIPIGKYIQNHLACERGLEGTPIIFGVNYFLKDENGSYLTGMQDKRVWLKWMELRVHSEIDAIATPIGFFPKHEDLEKLFKEVLGKSYSEDDYTKQFTLRVPQNVAKAERIIEIYRTKVADAPEILLQVLREQNQSLQDARAKHGDYIVPAVLAGEEMCLSDRDMILLAGKEPDEKEIKKFMRCRSQACVRGLPE